MEKLIDSKRLGRLLGDESVQSIRCSICLDYFERPVVLTCGHTFCFRCIKDTADHMLSRHRTRPPWHVYVECPQCRKPTNAYHTSNDRLPVNYTVSSLLSALGQAKVHTLKTTSTNTDLEERTENEQPDSTTNDSENQYVYDPDHLNEIENDLNSVFEDENRKGNNVIDDAREDIDKIIHFLTLDDIIEFETKMKKPTWASNNSSLAAENIAGIQGHGILHPDLTTNPSPNKSCKSVEKTQTRTDISNQARSMDHHYSKRPR